MHALLLFTVLAQAPDVPAAPGGAPPEQVLAKIAKGNLIITSVTCNCYGPATQEHTVTAGDPKGKEKIPVKVKVSSVMVTTTELDARFVEAYSVDGKAISKETLASLLAKERTVLVALDGKKVDPFHLQLYKDGTIVLVPPANTLNLGGYGGGVVGGYSGPAMPVPVTPFPEPLPPPRAPRRQN